MPFHWDETTWSYWSSGKLQDDLNPGLSICKWYEMLVKSAGVLQKPKKSDRWIIWNLNHKQIPLYNDKEQRADSLWLNKKTYFLGLLRLLSPFHSRRFWWLGNHLTQRSMEGDVSLCVRLKPGYDEERKPTSKGVVCCFHTKQFLSQGSFKGGHLKNDRSLFIQVDTVSSKSQTFQSEASNWLFRNPGAFVHLWFG